MRGRSIALAATLCIALAPPATSRAEEPAKPPAPAPVPAPKMKGNAAAKATPAKPLPVIVTVTATSPDPPWLLRIENQSDVPVRIPADSRLLRFDLVAGKGGAKKCAPPAGLVPSSFDVKRELFLRAGEIYEEAIDPRMYCFGETTDLLRAGTKLTPTFGFTPGWGAPKEPFAAEAADPLDPYLPLKTLKGEPFVLPAVPPPAPPPPPSASAPAPSLSEAGSGIGGGASQPAPPAPSTDASDAAEAPPVSAPAPVVDKAAGQLDIYLSRLVDAAAARDVVLTIRAKNEGHRKLAAVLRSRMLHFRVEELGADNRTLRSVTCVHQSGAHAIATEMVGELKPGKEEKLTVSIFETCPVGTFSKPGLYRVTPELDTSQEGEALKHTPWLGKALARQSALVRLATAKGSYYYASPRSGPLTLPPNTMLVASSPGDASQPAAAAPAPHDPAHHDAPKP